MSDPRHDPLPDPLPLLSSLFDGGLTDEQAAELRANIKTDPKYAEEVVLASVMHSNLRDLLSGQRGLGGMSNEVSGLGDAHILPALDEVEGLVQSAQPEALPFIRLKSSAGKKAMKLAKPRQLQSRGSSGNIPWRFVFRQVRNFAVAAMVLVAIGVGAWFALSKPAATVTNMVDVEWGNSQPALHVGDSLPKGTVTLAGGLLRVTFTGGASVVVQGPAVLQVESSSKMQLLSGRLTTAVPHEAIGFVVKTPSASIVDLGTEVGINVALNHQTHVEVFKGRAKVDMPDAAGTTTMDSWTLEPSMAVNVQGPGTAIEKATPQPLAFVRQEELLERVKAPSNPLAAWQAYSSELRHDSSLVAYYTFDNQSGVAGKLVNLAAATSKKMDGALQDVVWDQGRFPGKSSLHFNTKTSQVSVNVPGTFNQLTLTTWVNFDRLNTQFATLFGVDKRTNGGFDWKFTLVNGVPTVNVGVAADGAPIHFIGGAFDASKLQIGRWHFCVFNYDLDAQVIRCGVDGEWLRPFKGKRIDPPRDPIKIEAARIGNQKRSIDERAFYGRMDEFAIWSRTLSDDEIQAMYRAGMVR